MAATKLQLSSLYGRLGERPFASSLRAQKLNGSIAQYATREIRLPAGTERIVHVLGPVLARNLRRPKDYAAHEPVVAVRSARQPGVALVARHVEVLGPCRIDYTPDAPVPGTEGRAIAVMRTEAELILHVDKKRGRKR